MGNDLPEEVIFKRRCDIDIGELGKDEKNGLMTLDETSGAVGTVLSFLLSFSGKDAIGLPLQNRPLKHKWLACSTPIQTRSSRDGI